MRCDEDCAVSLLLNGSVVPLIYAFVGCFLHVPWPEIKPATLAQQVDALTNRVTWPGLYDSISWCLIANILSLTLPSSPFTPLLDKPIGKFGHFILPALPTCAQGPSCQPHFLITIKPHAGLLPLLVQDISDQLEGPALLSPESFVM